MVPQESGPAGGVTRGMAPRSSFHARGRRIARRRGTFPLKAIRARDPIEIGRAVLLAAIVAVVLERLAAIAGDLHLWGDGVAHLLIVASTKRFFFWVHDLRTEFFRSRLFTILGIQTPLLLAVHFGGHSLHALSKVFGLTIYSHGLLSLLLCYRYSPRRWYMLFPLLSLFAGSMNVEGYAITDSQFILSLYWPVLFILLFQGVLKNGALLVLLGLSVPMVVSYESMMFFGVILAGVCLWRWRTFPQAGAVMAGLALWYLLGAALAVAAVIWPFDPLNRSSFFTGLAVVLGSDHLAAQVSIVVLLCCAVLVGSPARSARVQGLTFGAGLVAILYVMAQALFGDSPSGLDGQAAARVLNVLAPLAATALLFAVVFGLRRPNRASIGLIAILVGALGFGQALWSLGYLMRWQAMVATLRYELLLHEGPIAYDNSILSRERLGRLNLSRLHAGWPLLPLSIYESEGGRVRSVVVPDLAGYLPFDPFDVTTFPDLSAYGVRYDAYRDALARNRRYFLGQTLSFSRNGTATPFMQRGWASPEDWARWSTAPDFDLVLPLGPTSRPGNVVLEAHVVPSLSQGSPVMSCDVFVNDVAVGQWSFHYLPTFEIRTMEARVPETALSRSNPVHIRFHIREALKSPAEMGKGADTRKLGLAFLKMRLYPANPGASHQERDPA